MLLRCPRTSGRGSGILPLKQVEATLSDCLCDNQARHKISDTHRPKDFKENQCTHQRHSTFRLNRSRESRTVEGEFIRVMEPPYRSIQPLGLSDRKRNTAFPHRNCRLQNSSRAIILRIRAPTRMPTFPWPRLLSLRLRDETHNFCCRHVLQPHEHHARTLKEEIPFPLFLVAQRLQKCFNLRIEDVSLFSLKIHIDQLAAAKMNLEILDNLFPIFCNFSNS